MTKFPKKIRLPLDAYSELLNPCVITIATDRREGIFKNYEYGHCCISILKALCQQHNFKLWAYCFMPDHLHLLIQGDGSLSIISLIQRFKSICTRKSRDYGYEGKIFQKNFYDHFLRSDEDVEKQVRYIFENPVRTGLIGKIQDYPLSGSEVLDVV